MSLQINIGQKKTPWFATSAQAAPSMMKPLTGSGYKPKGANVRTSSGKVIGGISGR